jgi:thiopeptide-type bacteriocin biosynthesis protein
MLRAPLLPIEAYLALGQAATLADVSTLLEDARVRHALTIGAPSLLNALARTPADSDRSAGILAKLRRYLVRMSTRPTPFGTFAGAGAVGWGGSTNIMLDGPSRTRTRVDMHWLVQYVMMVEAQAPIRNQLKWMANTAAWLHHNRLMLSERVPAPAGRPTTSVSIAARPIVQRALALARRPIPYQALARALAAAAPSPSDEQIARVLEELWDYGFLYTELMPPLTVEEPIKWIWDRLASITGGKALCAQLQALLRAVEACDAAPPGKEPEVLRKAMSHAAVLGRTHTGKGTETPLQVDMALSLSGRQLSLAVAKESARAAELLLSLTSAPNGPPSIIAYRQSFIARYGLHREVPLLELVHPEFGIGPLGGHAITNTARDTQHWAGRADMLRRMAQDAIRDGRIEIELDEQLLRRLKTSPIEASRMPASIDLSVFVLAPSCEAIDKGDFQVMIGPNVGAPVAGQNLGRFAHLLGPKACTVLADAARREEARFPHRITAEIAYLPRAFRNANVAVRPAVRSYEVNQAVSPGVDLDRVIPLDELSVGVRDGHFYVRWVPADTEVMFASGHMLNPNQATAELQLLSHISRDGTAQLSGFDWGPAANFAFLPRVRSDRVILHCAQWRLDQTLLATMPGANAFASWFDRWREQWFVPRRVYLSAVDNRLLYDLDDRAQLDDLLGELKRAEKSGPCILQEALPGPEHAWLPSMGDGNRIVELVVSLELRETLAKPREAMRMLEQPRLRPALPAVQIRPPGSEWLYLKLYGPRSREDVLLGGPVRRLCQEVVDEGLVEDWFFVRYADPDAHLRLRFRGRPDRLAGSLFPRLCDFASKLLMEGHCLRFSFDTYEREVERFGGPDGVVASEALFCADSRAVLQLIASVKGPERVIAAMITADDLLGGLGLDDEARHLWLKQTVPARKDIGDEYRVRKHDLIAAFQNPLYFSAPVGAALAERRKALASVARRLAALEASGNLAQPVSKLCESYLHLHCNRLLNNPQTELRVMGLLARIRDTMAHTVNEAIS